jgi:Domain of unknown function (DUF4410)
MLFRLCIAFALMAFSSVASPAPQQAAPEPSPLPPQPAAAAPAGAMTVYVSDFDLDFVRRKPSPKPAPRTSPPSKTRSTSRSPSGVPRTGPSASTSESSESESSESSDASAEETPAEQATALVNAVSDNIIRALTEAGYDARRLSAGAALPPQGVRLRGVFAEADEQNRARRLLVGGEPVGPNIILYVGVNNLKNPEQPLYELADPPAPDPGHGPVITVTSYAPAERFELSRDPSGDELKKVASKIAADLAALVAANRLSLAQ